MVAPAFTSASWSASRPMAWPASTAVVTLRQRLLVEGGVQVDGDRMPKRLGRVTASLGVRDQLADVRGGGGTDHRELDHHLLEIGRRIVDVVFLSVLKGGPDVRRGVLDRHLVEWREPRQLGEQSKRGPYHQVLQRRRAFLRATE